MFFRLSQSVLMRGERAVGELMGGVTGALMEPWWMERLWRLGGLDDEAEEEVEERFFSHGMREFASVVALLALVK